MALQKSQRNTVINRESTLAETESEGDYTEEGLTSNKRFWIFLFIKGYVLYMASFLNSTKIFAFLRY